jgi:translocation and assembly module TamB
VTPRRIIFLTLIAIFIAVPLTLIYYLSATADGLQFLVKHLPLRVGRAAIAVEGASGNLSDGFKIARITIAHERVSLVLEEVTGRIDVLNLLVRTVDIENIAVRRAFVKVHRAPPPTTNYTPRFLPPGITIRVKQAKVATATLVAINDRRFDTRNIYARGELEHRSLVLENAALQWDFMQIAGSAHLFADNPLRIVKADTRIVMAMEGQPTWRIVTESSGDLNSVKVGGQVTAPFNATLQGSVNDLTQGWYWLGNTVIKDLDLRAWGAGDVLGLIHGQLAIRGDAQGFSARGALTPSGLQAGALATDFAGSYNAKVLTVDRLQFTHAMGTKVQAAGTVKVIKNGPLLGLTGRWQQFHWPLNEPSPKVSSPSGSYRLNGVWPYDWQVVGQVALTESKTVLPVVANGKLAKRELLIERIESEALSGKIQAKGTVAWQPQESWNLSGQVRQIDSSSLTPTLPGRISFGFVTTGSEFGEDPDFSIDIQRLTGQIRGEAVAGGGQITRRDTAWIFDDVDLRLGDAHLQGSGTLAQNLAANFSIQSADLAWLDADNSGRVNASGTLSGTLQEPVVAFKANGNKLRYAGIDLDSLDAVVDFDAYSRRPSVVDLQLENLVYAERRFEKLHLKLNGMASDHQVTSEIVSSDVSLKLQANGSFSQGTWSGELARANLDNQSDLHLRLVEPSTLSISAQQLRLTPLCLRGISARLCGRADWTPNRWDTVFSAQQLPLATLTADLDDQIEYLGSVQLEGSAFGGADVPAQGELRAELTDARLIQQLASGKRQSILLGSGAVNVEANAQQLTADVNLDAGKIGTIAGQLTAIRSTEDWASMPLTGKLQMRTAELGYITLYVPQIDRAAGRLNTDLQFSGTVGQPYLDGIIELSDAEIDQYQVNLNLRAASLRAEINRNELSFNGRARIGDGQMSTRGSVLLRDSLPYGIFQLRGASLRIVNVPEARIEASPDLNFAIAGRILTVTGSVKVPRAKIVPTDLRNAVRSSADEIIVGASEKDPSKTFKVVTDISLILAENVALETSGLSGRLAGELRLRSGQDEFTSGSGELSIADGKYLAYGRKLDIQRGRLFFTGGPIGNPGVDIRAIKQFPEVLAGINVRGTLLQPRLTFFSEPSLPQSQILSLILAGGSLSAGQSTTAQPGQSGNELLAQGGAIIAQQIGQRVGIEDVSVESNLANETSLVFGKYLSPRLYISYGIGLAEAINTVKMRYSLNDRWTLRSEAGEERSADIVYTIEK